MREALPENALAVIPRKDGRIIADSVEGADRRRRNALRGGFPPDAGDEGAEAGRIPAGRGRRRAHAETEAGEAENDAQQARRRSHAIRSVAAKRGKRQKPP